MDIYAVVGLDGVDGFEFVASCRSAELVVSSSIEDCSAEQGTFEGATCDGYYCALSVLGVSNGIGFTKTHFQLHDVFQLGCCRVGNAVVAPCCDGDEKEK